MGRFRELVDIEEKMRILILSFVLPYDLVLLGQIATTRVYLLVAHP